MRKPKCLRLIQTKVVKEILTGINLSHILNFVRERIKGFLKGTVEGSLYNFSPEEEQQWQKHMDGYQSAKSLVGLKVMTPEQLGEALQKQREL